MIFHEESERIYATIPRSVYEILVSKANENVRSLSSQIAYALTQYYKDDVERVRAAHVERIKREHGEPLAQGVHHDKESEREIQD